MEVLLLVVSVISGCISASVFLTFFLTLNQGKASTSTFVFVIALISLAICYFSNKKRKQIYLSKHTLEELEEIERKKDELKAKNKEKKEQNKINSIKIRQDKIYEQEKLKYDKKREKELRQQEKLKSQIINVDKIKHISGLPIPDGTDVSIRYEWDNLKIISNGTNYNVECDRILGATYKNEKELVNVSHNSSIAGAVGGAMLLGPIGAIIGGRKTSHESYKDNWILAISYLKEEETKYLVFETKTINLNASKLVSNIDKREKQTIEVNL